MNNVFLGEPSDAIISHIDKRYYKHTVDAMNIDVSECYKVCEEKEATMPAEKTSSNLSATIQSIKVGYTKGDINVPVTGSITGVDSDGFSVHGDVCGSICGRVCGDIGTYENNCGICGTVYGGVSGSVYGGVCGGVYAGDIYCGVYGNIYGGVYGTVYGGVCGGVDGDIDRGVCGNVYGGICGDVSTPYNYCGICGNVYGVVGGWIMPSGISDSSVLTLDKTADENALLKIDINGTQYFIHVN